MTVDPTLASFPFRSYDKLRYSDVDSQGHVNNAVFATLLETGRVEVLYSADGLRSEPGGMLVIAHLSLDYRDEIHWPGTVDIGTRVTAIGRSSFKLAQALFQKERIVGTAETAIVLVDLATRRSRPLSDETRARLGPLLEPAP